ncbi:rhodanese-like domain-containing protein [Candidatus Pelagibacter ubique]|jgi:rhodanese-related sulfurtransferase|nr:rhodanese-like domain-containing protein [Candidatus Pelagibacter ubique]MDB9801961.1 rhodanese-like domain-containing protein [Candidatus Pelagibacter ubique]
MLTAINCKELVELAKTNKGASLIDVRTQVEWDQDGKPNGKEIGLNTYFISFMIDVEEGRIINSEFEKKFEELKLDKSKAVFVMCKSGFRSFKAAELIEKKGFKTFNIINGFICSEDVEPNCWKTSGLPVL